MFMRKVMKCAAVDCGARDVAQHDQYLPREIIWRPKTGRCPQSSFQTKTVNLISGQRFAEGYCKNHSAGVKVR
jgi:hypothetical protein